MRIRFPRTSACALASLLSLAAVPALAVDQDIELTATVSPTCTLSGSTAPSALTATIPVNNGEVSTAPITFDIPVNCNVPAWLYIGTLKGGLRGPSGLNGTANRIDYTAHISGGLYIPFQFDTETTSGETHFEGSAASGAPTGSFTLTVTPKQPALPLRNGTYTDTVRVSVNPTQ